jgi:hypothetical protein
MNPLLATIALLALPQSEGDFPLKIGSRWTYARGGIEMMDLEVITKEQTATNEVAVVRLRGGMFFLHAGSEILLSNGKEGLSLSWKQDPSPINPERPPQLLLPRGIEKSKRWESPGLKATVQDLELVRVPAGEFKAWRIDYVLLTFALNS